MITSIQTNITRSLLYEASVERCKAWEESWMSTASVGITTGNPKIAIKVALLPVFADIAAINVKIKENPRLASSKIRKNNLLSCTGFSVKKLSSVNASSRMPSNRKKLKAVLAIITDTGWAI